MRRWERLTGADIFRFDRLRLEKVFGVLEPRGKRKRRKIATNENEPKEEEPPAPANLTQDDAPSNIKGGIEPVDAKADDKLSSETIKSENDRVKAAAEGNVAETPTAAGNVTESKVDESVPLSPAAAV
eukprot:scaffold28776_cov61-Skeletonema_dohrnii-CCMP3373.AAC.1